MHEFSEDDFKEFSSVTLGVRNDYLDLIQNVIFSAQASITSIVKIGKSRIGCKKYIRSVHRKLIF